MATTPQHGDAGLPSSSVIPGEQNKANDNIHDAFTPQGTDEMVLDLTGKQVKGDVRIKTGDDLIPKTSFAPLADPEQLIGLHVDNIQELEDNMRYVYEDLMRIFAASKTTVTLWGPPGSGKTRSIESMAEVTDENGVNYQVITVQPSTQDATVMHGMMTITEDPTTGTKIMERSIPEIAQQVWDYFNDKDGLTIMFLDEMTTCIPAQQNAMLGLLTHGKYGNLDIHPYTTFVMAANPPGTVQTVQPLSEAVINRCGHIPWYSSYNHWYNKWKTGFGNPANAPDERTQDFIWNLIMSDPEYVFRFDPAAREEGEEGWDVDNLIPKDQMESSERVFTEVSRVYETINRVFRDAPYNIRELYIREAIRAVAGDRWANNAVLVEEKMESRITTEKSIASTKNHGLSATSTLEEVNDAVGDSLHRSAGRIVTADQEVDLADQFKEEIFANGELSHTKYLAFWVWIATFPHESTEQAVMTHAFNVFYKAATQHKGEMPRGHYLPNFVPKNIRDELGHRYALLQKELQREKK